MDDRRVIVVGSGPAAAAAARTLLERGMCVTMLESGLPLDHGLVVRAFGRNLYRKWAVPAKGYPYTVSGDPRTRWLSALSPGGLSNLWTGAVPRFAPGDFYEGARLHERFRWPFGYEDLAPYYSAMECLTGAVGERRSVPQLPAPEWVTNEYPLGRAWREISRSAEVFGQGMVRVPLADGPHWLVRRSGHAFNSYRGVIGDLLRFDRFRLLLGAHVVRLNWNSRRGCVDAVEYVDRVSSSRQRLEGVAVVVAAGPLASTKLLLQSTSSDFPHGLGNTEGVLGHYLHDHPNAWSVIELDRPLPVLDHNIYVSRAPYADSEPLMGAGIVIGALSKWDRVLSLTSRTTRSFGVVTFGTTVPSYDNYVRLNPDQRDEFGDPVLDVHIRFDAEAVRNVRDSQERLRSLFAAAGYASRWRTAVEDDLTPGWSAHFGGTIRMHSSPHYGMLNAWNRLHKVDNVIVADASSFTTGPEKNPTLTVMAVAARAANQLADDLITGKLCNGGASLDR